MFDVGFWELTLLAIIALIVLGPERLPVVARTAGRWMGRARSYVRSMTSELENEVDIEGFRQEVRQARESIESDARDAVEDIDSHTREAIDDIEDIEDSADEIDGDLNGVEPRSDRGGDGSENEPRPPAEKPRTTADDLAEYGDEEPFSVERARAEHARRDRESN